MGDYLIIGIMILLAVIYFSYIFKYEHRLNKFQEEMKVEDLCCFYDGEDKLTGIILEIKDGYVIVTNMGGKALFKIKKEEIYPI